MNSKQLINKSLIKKLSIMKKNVKNWNVEYDLIVLDRVLQLVDYQLSIDDWGVNWYNFRDWVNRHRIYWNGWKYSVLKVWILNNRIVREKIGFFDEESCNFVSGICLIGKGGIKYVKD